MDSEPGSSTPTEENALKFTNKSIFIDSKLINPSIGKINPPNPWRIQYLYPSKEYSAGVALGDLNGDGTLDVLTKHGIDDNVRIEAWVNNGEVNAKGLSFSSAFDLPIYHTYSFAVGDLNGDGLADIVVGRVDEENQVYLSQPDSDCNGNCVRLVHEDLDYLPIALPGTEDSVTMSVTIADVDGDGHLDIIFRDSDENFLLINNGKGDEYTTVPLPGANHRRNYKLSKTSNNIVVADMNNDLLPDILLCDTGLAYNVLLINKGNFEFDEIDIPGKRVSKTIAVGDVDGDGYLDIITGTQPVLLLNRGDGRTYHEIKLPMLDEDHQEVHGVALQDLNGDGLADFIYCGINGPKVLMNKGDGNGDMYEITFLGDYGPSSMAFDDIDGDGILDLAMTHSHFNYSHILLLSGEHKKNVSWYESLGINSIELLDVVLFLSVVLVLQLSWMCCCRSKSKPQKNDKNHKSSRGVLQSLGKKMKSEATESEMVSLQSSIDSDNCPDDD